MNLRCIALISSILLLFVCNNVLAQGIDTLKFAKHLKQSHLYTEQAVFNKKLLHTHSYDQTIKDSLLLELAFIYRQLHLTDSSKNALCSISPNNAFSDSLNQLYISLLILNKDYYTTKSILEYTPIKTISSRFRNDSEITIKILKRNLSENDSLLLNSINLSNNILDIKNRYFNYPHYSPALAGFYSAIVPGLGKWYIGYKDQAITAFASNVLLGSQAIESLLKAGVKSPRFIITTSLFSIFYAGNIIGSITMTKKKKRDYFNQLDYELLDSYSSNINSLYR